MNKNRNLIIITNVELKKKSSKNKNNKEKTVLLFIKDRGKKLYRKYVKQKQKNAIV